MRSFFSRPTNWAWEFNGMILAACIALGGGYTWLNKGHVRMDVFYEKFPPRAKAVVDLVLSVLFFCLCGCAVMACDRLGLEVAVKKRDEHHRLGPPSLSYKNVPSLRDLFITAAGICLLYT